MSDSLLARLGVFGQHAVEDAILASLVTADPVLFIGAHGSAKTLLASRLAAALRLRFWAYDAGKALFEELVGFPNPASLAGGKVDYAHTPLSISDKEFVLLDEISRASPSMQNRWLEIVRSRRIMGLDLPRLRYVFAAMNPPVSYPGAIPLDPALAGRFAFIIPAPEAEDMTAEDAARVIRHVGPDDAPGLGRRSADAGDFDLRPFVEDARLEILAAGDPKEMVGRYVALSARLRPEDHAAVITHLQAGLGGSRPPREIARSFLALRRLVGAMQSGAIQAPADAVRRALRACRDAVSVDAHRGLRGLCQAHPDLLARLHRGPDLVALRLAAHATAPGPDLAPYLTPWGRRRSGCSPGRFNEMVTGILDEFERHRAEEALGRNV